MNSDAAWAKRYQVLALPDALVVDVPRSHRARRAAAVALRGLPPGRGVVLRGSSSSVRAIAREARVHIARELIALPSAQSPAYLVEDDAVPLALLCSAFLSVPPGLARLAGPAGGLLRIGALAGRSRLVRLVLRSRIAVGWRV